VIVDGDTKGFSSNENCAKTGGEKMENLTDVSYVLLFRDIERKISVSEFITGRKASVIESVIVDQKSSTKTNSILGDILVL